MWRPGPSERSCLVNASVMSTRVEGGTYVKNRRKDSSNRTVANPVMMIFTKNNSFGNISSACSKKCSNKGEDKNATNKLQTLDCENRNTINLRVLVFILARSLIS